MLNRFDRRQLLAMAGALPVLSAGRQAPAEPTPLGRTGGPHVRISLNAYSFNETLRAGRMTLPDLLRFCAEHGFEAVDLTGYYFQGYPEPPSAQELRSVKRQAFVLGLEISGTGVRNDFTLEDPDRLQAEIRRVVRWLEVARDLGAPNLRVFAGRRLSDPDLRPETTRRVSDALRICAGEAERFGVMLAIQNHFEFIESPYQLLDLLAQVDSPWVAVNLDIGSFRGKDPYREIELAAPYAVAWQIKETVYTDGVPRPVELGRIAEILRRSAYRGYVLLETLEGDPYVKVPAFLAQLRAVLA